MIPGSLLKTLGFGLTEAERRVRSDDTPKTIIPPCGGIIEKLSEVFT